MKTQPTPITSERLVAKFFANIDERESKEKCWNWSNTVYSTGYGKLQVGRHSGKAHYFEGAHRFSYRMHYGENIPKGQHILHRCDNPRCVNPFHLFIGTPNDNMQDMIKKGRKVIGERVSNSKLKESDIKEIRHLRELGLTFQEIGKKFNVAGITVNRICKNLAWKHIGRDL